MATENRYPDFVLRFQPLALLKQTVISG